jgi:phenylacetate-CoA ligase
MLYGNKLTRKIYYLLPPWGQTLMCTVYGCQHKRRYRGNYFWPCFQALQQNQWKSTDEILHRQWQRLSALLSHAYQYVPFYRVQWKKLDISPKDIRSMGDFRKLPILEKEALHKHCERFLSQAFDKSKLILAHTSGTTGKQLTLFVSQEAYEREYSFRWHHYSWSGTKLGSKLAYLSGHPIIHPDAQRPPFSRTNYSERSLLFSSQHISENNLARYVAELRAFKPDLLEGYPSSIYLLATYMMDRRISNISVNGVYTTSETLFDFQRKAIECAFHCQVFDWYGNTERAGNITQCPAGSLHIQHEHAVTEILDGSNTTLASNDAGFLIFTALGNFAFPLIRYRIGDMAVPRDGACSCGRGGHLLQSITGRVEDYVVGSDGRYFGRLDHIFKDTSRVREAQIVQDRIDHLVFRVVPREGYGAEEASRILSAARARLGSSFHIDIVIVDRMERGPANKFRFVLSRLKPEQRPSFAPVVYAEAT